MREIKYIVIHCSATKADPKIDLETIRGWHVNERHWKDIGYHYVIKTDGTLQKGRAENRVGAHVHGYNQESIGICYVGGFDNDGTPDDTRTPKQVATMTDLVRSLLIDYPGAEVLGHHDFPMVNKACPCFDVRKWWSEANPSA